MENVLNVAKYIIEHERQNKRPLTGMKLQKLLYYAQVYSVILRDEKLFDADFYAWKNGCVAPVVEELHHGYFHIPASFPGESAALQPDSTRVLRLTLRDQARLTAEELSDRNHKELPWHVAYEQAKQLGMVHPNSWKTEMEVNMSENVKRGYKRQGDSVIPVPVPPGVDPLTYSRVLAQLADMNSVEDFVEALAESDLGLLAYITREVPFNAYSKARMIEAVGDHWEDDPDAVRSALISALSDQSSLVQDRAFRGLISFYYDGDPEVRSLIDGKPLETYNPAVRPTVEDLLYHA
ncbi:hypothetical protein DAETH_11910 [Deinococcus aetherius]|uniref:Antitoxin SocA-like Panacea domain-containing protein n=1 Tax=Deinococcus aetherius TaxID=200252 RepID=A0ABM8ABU6_9DEIO|nr:type II toxin-antitoxin system antitoxin SocA domain-containing protein [Deinococcus aetherius]BDP41222.1 hypothetical protein DAETH_11910 [Deinococcus aetherius]